MLLTTHTPQGPPTILHPPTTDIRGLRAEILSRIQIFTILSDFERFLAIFDQVLAILDPYTHNDVNYSRQNSSTVVEDVGNLSSAIQPLFLGENNFENF